MTAIVLLFALPLLLASAMIDPVGLHPGFLLVYSAIVFVALPFFCWGSFLVVAASPSVGESRTGSMLAFWIAASVTATAAIWFIGSTMSYPRPGARIDPVGHALIPFAPRAGIAIGLFTLSLLVACGIVGAIAPVLRREAAIRAAVIGGIVLFALVYGAGCALVAG